MTIHVLSAIEKVQNTKNDNCRLRILDQKSIKEAKHSSNYSALLSTHLLACLFILLSQLFLFTAQPRFPSLAIVITTAIKAWSVWILIIALLWFVQLKYYKLSTKQTIIFTGLNALVGFVCLIGYTYEKIQVWHQTQQWLVQ